MINIEFNLQGKFTLKIDNVVIGNKYSTESKACEKATKYLKGQNR